MPSYAAAILRNLFRESKRDALEAEWARRREERWQAALRMKLRRTLAAPPGILMVERASLECPHCYNMVHDDGIPANIITCPHCEATAQIKVWFRPRKPGRPETGQRAFNLLAFQKAQLDGIEQGWIDPSEIMRCCYFAVYRAVFQCPECSHLNLVKTMNRNSWKCGRCKWHWEVTICLQGLQLDVSSCKIVSAKRQEVAPAESISA